MAVRYRKIRRKNLNSMGKFITEAQLEIVKISFKVRQYQNNIKLIQYQNNTKYAIGSNSIGNSITGARNFV